MKKSRLVAYVLLLYVILLLPGYYLTQNSANRYGQHVTRLTILRLTPLYALLLLSLLMVPTLAVGAVVWIIKVNGKEQHASDR